MVPLSERAAEQLEALWQETDQSPYVFVGLERLAHLDTKPQLPDAVVNNVLRDFKRLQVAAFAEMDKDQDDPAERPTGTVHDLRKTCGTWMAEDGVPMHVLQRLMGHASITTTQRSYLGLTNGYADRVRGVVDHAFTRSLRVAPDSGSEAPSQVRLTGSRSPINSLRRCSSAG